MNYFTQKSEVQELLTDISYLTDDLLPKKSKEEILEIQSVLATKRFPVVFAGRFSSGKSLLVNRLFLGGDLLPSKNKPTTARNVLIEYGDEKIFCLQTIGKDKKIIEKKVPANTDTILEYCTHMGKRKEEFERFVLKMPLDILRNGVVFIDTVGTEDIDDHYVSQTINSLKEAAVVVYVTNALQPLAQSETEFLKEYLSDTPKKLFLAANKIDGRENQEDRDQIIDDLKDRFHSFFKEMNIRGDNKIFLVSAKTEEGLEALRDHLLEFLGKERVKELVFQCVSGAKGILDTELTETKSRLQLLEKKYRGEKEDLIKNQEELEALENHLSEKTTDYEEMKDELREFAERELQKACEQAENRALNTIANRKIALKEVAMLVEREIKKAFDKAIHKIQSRFLEKFQKRLSNHLAQPGSEEVIGPMRKRMNKYFAATSVSGAPVICLTLLGIGKGIAAAEGYEAGFVAIFPWLVKTWSLSSATTAALPYLLPGLMVTGLASVTYFKMKKYKKDSPKLAIRKFFSETVANIEAFTKMIDNSVEQIVEETTRKIAKEKKALQSLIEETQPEIIEKEISEQKLKSAKLEEYTSRLSRYIGNGEGFE